MFRIKDIIHYSTWQAKYNAKCQRHFMEFNRNDLITMENMTMEIFWSLQFRCTGEISLPWNQLTKKFCLWEFSFCITILFEWILITLSYWYCTTNVIHIICIYKFEFITVFISVQQHKKKWRSLKFFKKKHSIESGCFQIIIHSVSIYEKKKKFNTLILLWHII